MVRTKGLRRGSLWSLVRLWPFSSSSRVKSTDQKLESAALFCGASRRLGCIPAASSPHSTSATLCASATRAGITMGMPPHTKCCGCCCNLHVGTMIGTGLYVAYLFIVTIILPAIFGQEGADQAKAFCKGTTPVYRQGKPPYSALPSCTRRSTHPGPAPASLPGAQATTCVTAPISATTTWTRWR